MGDISRVRSTWTGFLGAPGVTTMYFVDTSTAVESVHAFWASMSGDIPGDVDIQVESAGDTIESTTGALTGAWVSDPVAVVHCGGSGVYAAPVGACVDWLTGTIAHGRRLRGRSFIVPITASSFQSDGTLLDAFKDNLTTYATTLITEQSASFCIWHRGTGSDGSTGIVTSAHVPDMAAVLRSRRD